MEHNRVGLAEGRQSQGRAPAQAELTEVLEHMEVSTLPEHGQLQDGVALIVRVQHEDLPVAFRSGSGRVKEACSDLNTPGS